MEEPVNVRSAKFPKAPRTRFLGSEKHVLVSALYAQPSVIARVNLLTYLQCNILGSKRFFLKSKQRLRVLKEWGVEFLP